MSNQSLTLLLFGMLLFACNKAGNDSQTTTLPQAAETKPQFDNTSFGVYKGVVIGSTGTVIIRINNGDNIVKAFLSITNTKDTLSASQPVVSGQAIRDLRFSGRLSSFNFSADADGGNVRIANLIISGHPNATAIAEHENSSSQIYCYEGTFSGERSGNICFIRTGPLNESPANYNMQFVAKQYTDTLLVNGIGKPDLPDTSANTHYFTGTTATSNPYLNFSGKGKFSGNNFSGYWTSYHQTAGGNRGSFSCVRTY